ncbi:hypothetical protein PHIN8_02980 [Polynucleobacter sp. HIN8]|uniref:glycosyltransferase family 2 protein n=1 Tax=Polynucleobacter sp. HIN8 TaxID=3047867 RepID=UPI0025739F46|nr:glycosyltransferase family 2 protein [Polynucleobacter sp. HIN8]BEI38354.1 hypothetical protein PHIN8_02980 [Polynucleobacter sp. HIN8]
MDLAVVIPTYNRFTITKQCINTLKKNEKRNILIIICDSSSTDNTPLIKQLFDNLEFIDVGPNTWWSGAVNAGIKKAEYFGYRNVLVLNDDLYFDFNLIDNIIEASKRHPDAIISASQETNSKLFIGSIYSGIFKKTQHLYNNLNSARNLSQIVESTNGSCLYIPCKVFKNIGYFDEVRCPHLYGDTEFQLRALNAGIKIICDLNVRVVQQPTTDYIRRLSLSSILTAPDSPFKISAYWAFCNMLFKSKSKAVFFGVWHHYFFIIQLTKAVFNKCWNFKIFSKSLNNYEN